MSQAFDSIFESTIPTKLADGFVFAEGPVWHPDNLLYFSDIRDHKRYLLNLASDDLKLIAEDTDGANGMTFNADGELVYCHMGKRRVSKTSRSGDEIAVATHFAGKLLNAPNDIVPHSDGSLYFTNPQGRISGPDAEIGYSGVYRIGSDGAVTEVCSGMNLPNGLAFSPDESKLYVSNTRPDPKLLVFDMQSDGTAVNGRVIDEMPLRGATEKNGVPDGLKVDSVGRIFVTGPAGIWVWDESEKFVGILEFDEVVTNLAWGGDDLRTMFVTAHSSVYSLRTIEPGIGLPVFE